MENSDLIKRLNILISKAEELISSVQGSRTIYVDAELRAEFRTTGLSLFRELFEVGDVHYVDFERCTAGLTPADAKKARGILRALLQEFQEGRRPDRPVARTQTEAAGDRRCVFVVYGRNVPARQAIFTFLRALGLEPLEWSEAVALTGVAAPYVGPVLEAAFRKAQAVVVVLTGDDLARLQTRFATSEDPSFEKELTPQARPNVLFEAGMAFGRHPSRTILLALGETRPFSDVAGRHTLRLTNDASSRQQFLSRLKTAGCAVDDAQHRIDWLHAGDFDGAVCGPEDKPRDPIVSAQNLRAASATQPNPADEAKYSLLPIIHEVRKTLGTLPTEQRRGEEVRKVTLWPDSEPITIRNLAAQFGMNAARFAAEATPHLATIAEHVKSVQQTPRVRGFDWGHFDWKAWVRAIEAAERCLVSLNDSIDPNWRSLV